MLFKENYPDQFKQAHLVLFEYFQKLPEKEFPDTLEEMQSLYRAVTASFCFMSLGRLAEAIKLREASIELLEKEKSQNRENLSISAAVLAELLLLLGALNRAEDTIRLSAKYAEGSGNKIKQAEIHSFLAYVLRHSALFESVRRVFQQAEELLKNHDYPYLYSTAGVQYCLYLLDTAKNATDFKK